jgi:S1-C subfamily serine protease
VLAVELGSGAAEAGITAGSVITAVGNRTVTSANDLTRALVPYNLGERVRITWTAPDGSTQRATVTLGSGPPA